MNRIAREPSQSITARKPRPRLPRLPFASPLTVVLILAGAASLACGRDAEDGTSTGNAVTLELPAEALRALQSALDQYEALRSMLAKDAPADLERVATRLAADLAAAKAAWPDADAEELADLREEIESAAAAAGMLAAADDLLDSRQAFGELSRHLLPAAAADARLRQGRRVLQCPMTETFPFWMQDDAEAGNPYLGAAMPTCGEPVSWDTAAVRTAGTS